MILPVSCLLAPNVGYTIRLVLAVVMSRVDYCNSLLAGLPQSTLVPLQRVQNTAARQVFELGTREHVTPILHWLLVGWRVQFKLSCIRCIQFFYGNSPAYLTNIVHPTSAGRLSSPSSSDYSMPRLRTKFGERAFSHAGPAVWRTYAPTKIAQFLGNGSKNKLTFLP